jgi:excisionase family DNA binding protein
MVLVSGRDPILADEDERERIEEVERVLGLEVSARAARLIGPDGVETELPEALYAVLVRAAHVLAAGQGVSVLPMEALLTTQQAANLLDISRPSLIKLLDDGQLPFHRIRSHRRIRLSDLIEFRQRRDAAAETAMRRMVHRAQEIGIYDEYRPATTR